MSLKILQYSQENAVLDSIFFFKKKQRAWRPLTQVFSFKYCEIFKNTFFEEHLQTAASDLCNSRNRSSPPEVFWKSVAKSQENTMPKKESFADAVTNFASFTEKHLCWSLQHRCFPVKFSKFLRTPLFTEHPRWLLLNI